MNKSMRKTSNIVTFDNIKVPDTLREFVSVQHGVPTCTSVQVAEKFGMEHKDVLRLIEGLIAEKELICGKEGIQRTCAPYSPSTVDCYQSEYVDEINRKRTMYLLTKTGFPLVAMASKSLGAKKWRRKFIEAFDQLQQLVLDEANRKIMQLTKPQESVWVPVYNEWDRRYYKVLAPMENYTEAQRLVIRKAAAIVHAKSILANAKKWERQFLNGEGALSYMPSINCEVDKDGNFLEMPRASELKIGRLPKLCQEAYKRTQWAVAAIKKKLMGKTR